LDSLIEKENKKMNSEKEIIFLIGISGSGKSSYFNSYYSKTHQLICKDDIRLSLGTEFDYKLEPYVHAIGETMMRALMIRGLNIVVDEINLDANHLLKMKKIAKEYGYKFNGIMLDFHFDLCCSRREEFIKKHGIEVINKMKNKLDILKKILTEVNFFDTLMIEIDRLE